MRFVDTSFWIALQNRSDSHGDDAAAMWRAGPGPVVTTNLVIGETWTFLRRRAGHPHAVRFLDRVGASQVISILHVDEPTEEDAWRWLRRHDERKYSFVDATSFAVMRRMRIREALAFDGDFAAAGFIEARP
ncbi:MAG: PIN domain-containing protein [Actinomycetota bacterium]